MSMNYTTIDMKDMASAISQALSSVASANKAVQNVLINILLHIEKNGDPVHANRLVTAEEVSAVNRKAIIDYLTEFGKVNWDKDAKVFSFDKTKVSNINGKKGAKEVMWWEFKKHREPTPTFDYSEEIAKINKKAVKKLAERVTLASSGDTEKASSIVVNEKVMQAVRLLTNGSVSPDIVLKAAGVAFKQANAS